jgi:DNA-binding NarL/FixJ family response regulator
MSPLTHREREVPAVQGATNKEIGRALGLSPRTIEIYRASLLHKFGARNAVDLVRKTLTAANVDDR